MRDMGMVLNSDLPDFMIPRTYCFDLNNCLCFLFNRAFGSAQAPIRKITGFLRCTYNKVSIQLRLDQRVSESKTMPGNICEIIKSAKSKFKTIIPAVFSYFFQNHIRSGNVIRNGFSNSPARH